jgi:uncharacterized Tic20 family protein
MSATYEHPSLRIPVTPEQRDRAEHWLQEAYADGRISEDEFDHRIGQVLSAATRRELNDAFFGLVQVPTASRALGVHPAYQPLVRPETRQQAGRGVAAVAHFSTFVLPLMGPGLVFALSQPGSYPRKEAAKAFNFQLVSMVAWLALIMVGEMTGLGLFDWLIGLLTIAWVFLTIVGGGKALQGEDWKNPVKHVVKFEVLSER